MVARALAALAFLPLLVGAPSLGGAADFERLAVTESSGTYRVEASVLIAARREAVLAVLRDFEGHTRIAPFIREVKVLGTTPQGETSVRVVTEICVGPFCKDLTQVQRVRFIPPGLLEAVTDRAGSDAESGHTSWDVTPAGERTRVRIVNVVRPTSGPPFFIPRRWVLAALARQARQCVSGLEALALSRAPTSTARAPEDAAPVRPGDRVR
jgi:Polyketide cyclase / dehydrase and lipid transport